MAVTISWDGNTAGREAVSASYPWYKVSNRVFTYEELSGLTIGQLFGSSGNVTTDLNITRTKSSDGNCIKFGSGGWGLSGKAGTYTIGSTYTLPSDGTYFIWYAENHYTNYLSLPNATGDSGEIVLDTNPVYKKIDGAWVKQTAYQRQDGEWVLISSA